MKGFSGEWKKKFLYSFMSFPNKAAKHADVVTTMPVVFRDLDSEKVEI